MEWIKNYELRCNNGFEELWLTNNGDSDCEFQISLGNWATVGFTPDELEAFISNAPELLNHYKNDHQ